MIKGIIYDREDTCPNCNRKRAIELYDKNNRPGYFSMILDRNELHRLHIKQFYYMKCRFCNKEYRIDWSKHDRIPIPLTDNILNYFLNDYNNSYGDNS